MNFAFAGGMHESRNVIGFSLIAAGAAAAAGFMGTAHAVRTRKAHATDRKLRRHVRHDATVDTPKGRSVERVQKIGKWWVQAPMAAVASAALWRAGHRRAAGAVALASASSALTAELMDGVIFRRTPPPGHPKQSTPSFPSGHALQLASVSLTLGYVAMREELAPAAIAIPLAIAVPLVSSGGRLWQDRHWASDVLGGWLAAMVIASWSTAAYELVPPKPRTQSAMLRAAAREHARHAMHEVQRGAKVMKRGATRAVTRGAERVQRRQMVLGLVRAFAEDVLLR